MVKTWDVVIIGGGVIGLSLAWRLRRHGASVLIVEKSEPGREATHAAGGMIAHCDPHNPPALASLIAGSARMYPEFVRELREASFESPDLRTTGTIAFFEDGESPGCEAARCSLMTNSRASSHSSACAVGAFSCQRAASILENSPAH